MEDWTIVRDGEDAYQATMAQDVWTFEKASTAVSPTSDKYPRETRKMSRKVRVEVNVEVKA